MRVLVSGAGIAGPTIAWYLAKTGARVTVIEKSSALFSRGQHVDIRGSAVKVVGKMGLLDEIREHSTTEKGTRIVDTNGKTIANFPITKDKYSPSLTTELEILRGDLASILYESTKDLPNVDYRFETTVEKVLENSEATVKVELSTGETPSFDLLVAADGQWSRIRKQIYPPEDLAPIDTGMYAVYYTMPRLESDDEYWKIYIGLGASVLSVRSDSYDTMRACITCIPSKGAPKQAWENALKGDRQTKEKIVREHFAGVGWQADRILEAMSDAPDFHLQGLKRIKVPSWSRGRIVFLGDAAYGPILISAKGSSFALTGAYVLGGELSKLAEGEHPRRAPQAYEEVYRPFVEESQNFNPCAHILLHPKSAWHRWLLTSAVSGLARGIALVQSSPWLQNRFASPSKAPDDFPLPVYTQLEPHLVHWAE